MCEKKLCEKILGDDTKRKELTLYNNTTIMNKTQDINRENATVLLTHKICSTYVTHISLAHKTQA